MVGGSKYSLTVGSRAQVWNGTAYKTGYGKKDLKRSDLIRNKHGRIVSKKKHAYGKSKGKRCRHNQVKRKVNTRNAKPRKDVK